MTRIVVALDSFKGSITAAEAARALAAGLTADAAASAADVEVVLRPMADGGEGTLDAFEAAVPGARRMPVRVTGPAGDPVAASWLLLPDGTGVVELASTSGIELLGGGADAAALRGEDADTTGFGQAIAAALGHGIARIVLGIGSSASTDGGVGMLRALGARFTDAAGADIARGAKGLRTLAAVDLSGLLPLPAGGAVVLTDVTNPLLGPAGAAAVFGPQKGLDAAGVARADAALARLADLVTAASAGSPGDERQPAADRRRPLSWADTAGAGAAGGTGFGLLAWGARLVPGAAEVASLVDLARAIDGASLVVTGEGSFDGQSAAGKVPAFVQRAAAAADVPVALVAGRIAPDADTSAFAASVSLTALAGSPTASFGAPAHWLHAAGVALRRSVPTD
ncbi:glycerate kinase [Microbacterium telephonicum]|uniref:Glycerate kinase n=1 Tax=Microbacterium telephonicum TaxID=1714841 RepID=A0A498CK58_9MICO|nr:glycerate kinase [Microbacterium telephonicum]RLK52468.1 glycerate kinase [Microbacterium telephonicum]